MTVARGDQAARLTALTEHRQAKRDQPFKALLLALTGFTK
jgi:hypothetical protein